MASDINFLQEGLFPGMTSDSNFSFDGTLGLMNGINLSAGIEETNSHSGCEGLVIKLESLPEFDLNSPSLSESSSTTEPQGIEPPIDEHAGNVNVPFFGFPFCTLPSIQPNSVMREEIDQFPSEPTNSTNELEVPQFIITIPSLDTPIEKKKDFQCLFCFASFNSNHKLCWHQNSCNNNPFVTNAIVTSESPETYKCSTCSKSFRTNAELVTHTCPSKRYSCEICGKSYSNICVKSRHMQSHSNVRPHECNVCHKTFIRKEYLTSHLRIHTGDRPYSCHVCGKRFAYSSAKRSHVRLHTTKPFICSICHRNFISSDKLKRIPIPGKSDLIYSCEKCCNASETPILKTPSVEPILNPSNCERLNMKRNIAQLVKNQKTAIRNLKCEFCPRLYIRRSDLTKHMRTHTTETITPTSTIVHTHPTPDQPPDTPMVAAEVELSTHPGATGLDDGDTGQFVCHLCNRRFAKKRLLLRHIYAHLGIKPYACSVCVDKKYARKEDLVLHMRTHTGERPFECGVCDKKFIRRKSYKMHRQTHFRETATHSNHCIEPAPHSNHCIDTAPHCIEPASHCSEIATNSRLADSVADNVGVVGEPEN